MNLLVYTDIYRQIQGERQNFLWTAETLSGGGGVGGGGNLSSPFRLFLGYGDQKQQLKVTFSCY
jgi:hypothetical protein